MNQDVVSHYSDSDALVESIAASLRASGIDPASVTTADLAGVDEFHIRGREATLALAESMGIRADTTVLDIGSGLGGAARTLAEAFGRSVTGIDLTPSFCAAATELSRWTGLEDRTTFRVSDACALPFDDDRFDAAITIHAAMNIPDKPAVYREARRVLRPAGMFAVYDVLQGKGGDVLFPVPWAREPSISFGVFLGGDLPRMAANQVANLAQRRIRTVSYLCRA